MIGRVLGLVVLGASVGLAEPNLPAAADARLHEDRAATITAPAPPARLHAAIESALQANVPGMAGRHWVLHDLQGADGAPGAPAFIVATGVVTTPGGPDTHVRLTGRFDPGSGSLQRVAYRLQPSPARAHAEPAGAEARWSVQDAVNHAFTQVLPDERVAFALESAQSTRVEGGGRRFDGSGIGTWNQSETRFVAFTMTLSATGELVAFDYSTASEGTGDDVVQLFASSH